MCLFCKIAAKEIPATIVYETETVLAFKDIAPQAPVHIVIVPRAHIDSLNDLKDPALMVDLLQAAQHIAQAQGVAATGYRVVTNIGTDGGQSVGHLHLHLLGGRRLSWPPG